jgi:hypothetical protein
MRTKVSLFALFLMLSGLSIPAHAIYLQEGPFSNDFTLSKPLDKSQFALSAQAEYADLSDINLDNYDLQPMQKQVKSQTVTVIPFKIAYGVTDNFSVRWTIPYFSEFVAGRIDPTGKAYGIGDMKFEGLYQVLNETKGLPSVGINFGTKVASGKSTFWLGKNELRAGTGSTDFFISGVFAKDFGAFTGKGLIGYYYSGVIPYFFTESILPASSINISIACSKKNGAFEYGGELWGDFAGRDLYIYKGTIPNEMGEYTETSAMYLSPYIYYAASPSLSFKGVIDIPLGSRGTYSYADMDFVYSRGVNYIIGATWTI